MAATGAIGARFILAAGNVSDARLLSHAYRAGEKQACFHNAFALARAHPELTYCEGLALNVFPVEHAWCLDPDGRVADNTWGQGPAAYAGVAFDTKFVIRWVAQRQRYSVLAEMFPRELLGLDPATYLANPAPERLRAVEAMVAEACALMTASPRA